MRSWLAGAVLLLSAAVVQAQDPDARRIEQFERAMDTVRQNYFEKSAGKTLVEHMRLLYGAYTTLSGLVVDDEDGESRILRQVDSRLWVQAQAKGHMFFGRLRFRYRDFNTGDGFTGDDNDLTEPIGDRYWYRFDWRTEERAETGRDTGWNWWVQVGRQYVNWVSGIVLSEQLHAVRAGIEVRTWNFGFLVGHTPNTGPIDFDASRPGFTSDVERFFWGVSAEYRGIPGHAPYVYFVRQEDENDTVLGSGVRFGYDSWYVAVGNTGQIVTGQWLYRAEFIYQGGRSTSDSLGTFPQTLEDISAWAGRVQVIYVPVSLKRWAFRGEFELLLGSGDSDRAHGSQTAGGNQSGTDDESFNDFGYVNTGLALAPELANLLSVRMSASAAPLRGVRPFTEEMRLGLDLFFLFKMDEDAPMTVSSVEGESFLGVEVDLVVDWNLTDDAAIDLRYGVFFPSDAFPFDNELHFFFLGFSYGF